MRGDWNQKEKRRRWKPKFYEKGWKASQDTLPDGEGRHERVHVISSRRESEAPGEEGDEVKSPKRKIIRVDPKKHRTM